VKENVGSVVDVDPEDPYVLGPSGSGSLHHQAKKLRKTFFSTVCDRIRLFIFFIQEFCK
jgi:hypothetical protein